ncbi:TonB-dependent receptor, partial [candidate division WOR-3 bacterium]|nr:TonB-dependent receptor [candidate division WOR-3 bacterium]
FRLSQTPIEMSPVDVRPAQRLLEPGPVPTEVVTSAAIAEKCAANVQEALRWQPGVSVKTKCPCSNAAEVQIQGMAGRYTQVLVDGAPTVSDVGSFYGLTNLASENVERLEVIKGAGGLQHSSDAIAGAVNIITKSAEKTGGSVSLNAGSFGVLALGSTMNLKEDNTGVTATLSHSRTDPVDVDEDGNSDYVKTDRTALALKARQQLAAGLTLVVGANVGIEERHGGLLERIAGRTNTGLYQNPNILQWGPNAALEWEPWEATSLMLRGAYSDYRQRVFAAEQWFTAFEDAVFVEATGRRRLGASQELLGAVSYRSEHLVENMRTSSRTVRVTGAALQDEIRFHRLTLVPHARYEHHSDFGSFLTPGMAVMYQPTGQMTLRGTFGLGNKTPPTLSKLTHFCPGQGMYDFLQNPDLRPERSNGGNAGIEYHPGSFVVSGGAFRTDLRDMIEERLTEYDTLNRLRKYQYRNVGSVTSQGLELNCGLRMAAGISLRAGYTFTDARDRESREALVYRSRHGANWQAAYDIARATLRLSLTGEFVGSMPTQQRGHEHLMPGPMSPNYTVWNVRAAKELGSAISLSAGVDNVFNYVQTGWFVEDVPLWGPSRGRAVNLGARFNF